VHSAVTVSLVPQASGGPFVFWSGLADACERASALGFEAIEIFPPTAEAVDVGELRRLLDRFNLRVAAIGTGGGWVIHKWHLCHQDTAVRHQARHFVRSIIDLAASFEAPAIVGSLQGRVEAETTREQALTHLAEALADLGTHARDRGQALLYEPLNRYETNLINRCEEAAEFLTSRGIENVRLLCDLFHMNIEEASVPDALRAVSSHIGHVHFADSNRRAAGFGHTDMASIIRTLRDVGYTGYLSAEVLPIPDPQSAASQTIRAFREGTR